MGAYTNDELVRELFKRYQEAIFIGYATPKEEIDIHTKFPRKHVELSSKLPNILDNILKKLKPKRAQRTSQEITQN